MDAREDAPRDGGPSDPDWVMLEGQPDGVELFVARHPERVVSVEWENCGAGCLRAVPSVRGAWLAGYVDGGRRVAWVQLPVELQVAALIDIDTGRALAAWRLWDVEAPTGQLGAPAYGGGRVAISGYGFRSAEETQLSAWTAPVGEVVTTLAPAFRVDVSSSLSIVGNLVSATHRAWLFSPTSAMQLADDAGGRRLFPGAGVDALLVSGQLVGDRVFYELWADRARVWTGSIEEGPRLLLDADPADIRSFRTDGRTMAWLQGYDYDESARAFARIELWAAPYAERAEDVAARRVFSSFRGVVQTTVGGHWLASQAEGPGLDVFDLEDGTRRTWAPPDDGIVADPPLYAVDSEILVRTTVGTFRIDPNTLPLVGP